MFNEIVPNHENVEGEISNLTKDTEHASID